MPTVAPAGIIDVHNAQNERVIALNIPAESLTVAPQSTSPSKHVYSGALSQGLYDIRALFGYHGEEAASLTGTAEIEQDIIPAVVPEAPEFRASRDAIPVAAGSDETSLLTLAFYVLMGGVLGIVALLALLAIGWRAFGFDKR